MSTAQFTMLIAVIMFTGGVAAPTDKAELAVTGLICGAILAGASIGLAIFS